MRLLKLILPILLILSLGNAQWKGWIARSTPAEVSAAEALAISVLADGIEGLTSGQADILYAIAGGGALVLSELDVDNINLNGNTISSTAGTDLLLVPLAGQDVVIDGHFEFDGNLLTAVTDNNTILAAYAGKNITIESVTFDGGAVAGVTTLAATGKISALLVTEQFRLSYDATNYATWTVAADGALTLVTEDASAAEGDINFNPDGFVGIKTAVPTVELDVTGSIVASVNVAGATYGSDASITDAELLYVNTLSSNAQTQIDAQEAELDDSAGLLAALDDETGTGLAVFGTAPSFVTSVTMGSAELSEAELEILDGALITTAEANLLDGSAEANSTVSVAAVLNSGGDLVTASNVGTVGAGTVVAAEYGDGFNHTTVLTLTAFVVGTPNAGNNSAIGGLIYTLPAGVNVHQTSYYNIGLTVGGVQTDTPEIGIGSVVGSGAIATLDNGTMEDYVISNAWSSTLDGSAEVFGPVGAQAGVLTGISLNKAADVKEIYLNSADGWNAGLTGDMTADGTIILIWNFLE